MQEQWKELEALREWARATLAVYTGVMATIALRYPDQSQVPLNASLPSPPENQP